jgi:hypothetical protein
MRSLTAILLLALLCAPARLASGASAAPTAARDSHAAAPAPALSRTPAPPAPAQRIFVPPGGYS